MTLILALGNSEHVAQISDRRLSCNGKLVDDESNKCGVLVCLNARMTFGYTGLAKWENFSTIDWLLKALHHAASPDFTIGEILERLKVTATKTFREDPRLINIPMVHKKLAVMFSGFINLDGCIKPGCAILSNYHNFANNTSFAQAQEEFSINYTSAKEGESNPTLVQRVGNWHAMKDSEIDELRTFLSDKKPDAAIIGKACEIVRDIADRPKSSGTIGKQLTTIVISSDPNKPINTDYSTSRVKSETYMPAMVYLLPDQHMTVSNVTVRPVESDTPPISIPKVGRNAPCPCGSSKKYKHCHGKKRR
ncbi:MAG: SEC-C domain-containing protein [Campylobacterales bacterium]|nr:SEC-C domain-containing protein [Campylobacterales bacterium]